MNYYFILNLQKIKFNYYFKLKKINSHCCVTMGNNNTKISKRKKEKKKYKLKHFFI